MSVDNPLGLPTTCQPSASQVTRQINPAALQENASGNKPGRIAYPFLRDKVYGFAYKGG